MGIWGTVDARSLDYSSYDIPEPLETVRFSVSITPCKDESHPDDALLTSFTRDLEGLGVYKV